MAGQVGQFIAKMVVAGGQVRVFICWLGPTITRTVVALWIPLYSFFLASKAAFVVVAIQ
jgi:hypothetical protein